MKIRNFALAPIAAAIMLLAAPARAVPQLQLDIFGGTYDTSTETIVASGNSFSVYAYGLTSAVSLSDSFYLSMALMPSTSSSGSYGSFAINGTPINVTAGMTFGTPPLETVLGGASFDPGDLASHGIFPTYFAEQLFTFSSGVQSGVYNTQDHAGWGPQSGTGMYYKKFDFDISGLAPGFGIHFDLYNETLISSCKNKNCTVGDIDVNKFAPFSHDAEGTVITSTVPEPEIYAMLSIGLGFMGWAARRKKLKGAAA